MSSLAIIERFLAKYGMLARLLMGFLWVLWAAQMSGAIADYAEQEKYYSSIDIDQKARLNNDYFEVVNQAESEAKALGKDYSPTRYYRAMRNIEQQRDKLEKKYRMRTVFVSTERIYTLALNNMRSGRFSQEETTRAVNEYEDWKRSAGGKREELVDKLIKSGWPGFFGWLWKFLLRGMLLSFLLYLLRMCEREGIASTFSKSKPAFLRAVLLWPVFVWEYPYSIIRELRLEAEFRRLGSAFRKLTVAEKISVRTIAASKDYGDWIRRFRWENRLRFRRSLLAAMIPALLLYFCPMHALGSSEIQGKGVSGYSVQISHDCNKAPPDMPAAVGTPFFRLEYSPPPSLIEPAGPKEIISQEVARDIDHIPLQLVICAN